MATVHCTVSNCNYWGQNNYCRAEQILVTALQSSLPSTEQHGLASEKLPLTPVKTRQESLCYTMELKNR